MNHDSRRAASQQPRLMGMMGMRAGQQCYSNAANHHNLLLTGQKQNRKKQANCF